MESAFRTIFHSVRESVTPLLKESKFKETGVLTPEEFVLAGDYLTSKFPTWSWAMGDSSKIKAYLPADKQYLITRNVSCTKRVKEIELDSEEVPVDGDDGDWVTTNQTTAAVEVGDVDEVLDKAVEKLKLNEDEIPDIDDLPDIDDEAAFVDNTVVENDTAALKHASSTQILRTRSYDLSITYDKYYQTPRVWLSGYDENRSPLKPEQIFEDISQDHARKTVTIDPHPHENLTLASIHPCKHSNVMKRIIDQMESNEGREAIRIDQYLLLFLKFVATILPTMEYDYTASMDV